ncbi:MAG: DUF1778 domain-containing protein [Hydrogenovibrio sp.]
MSSASLPRITARVDIDTQELLYKAAALSGVSSINAFVLNSAVEKAKQIIEKEEVLKLSEQDSLKLMDALDQPAMANKKLQSAFSRYEASQN